MLLETRVIEDRGRRYRKRREGKAQSVVDSGGR